MSKRILLDSVNVKEDRLRTRRSFADMGVDGALMCTSFDETKKAAAREVFWAAPRIETAAPASAKIAH